MLIAVLSESTRDKLESNIIDDIRSIITSINSELPSHEHIGKILLSKDDWTIENDFLTPTMKVKRRKPESSFMPVIQQSDENTIAFV